MSIVAAISRESLHVVPVRPLPAENNKENNLTESQEFSSLAEPTGKSFVTHHHVYLHLW